MQIASVLCATLLVTVLIGCSSHNHPAQFPTDDAVDLANELLDTQCLSKKDVERAILNARHAEQAIVFVHLGWSAQSAWATFPFAQFMLDYTRSHPNRRLLFHYIDCSSITDDYSPLTEILGWPAPANGGSLINGYGEVVWLENGWKRSANLGQC
jgi:hypothetical protein